LSEYVTNRVRMIEQSFAYIARYGHQQASEMMRMPWWRLEHLRDDLEDIVARENGPEKPNE
jgi:hypothetical protein